MSKYKGLLKQADTKYCAAMKNVIIMPTYQFDRVHGSIKDLTQDQETSLIELYKTINACPIYSTVAQGVFIERDFRLILKPFYESGAFHLKDVLAITKKLKESQLKLANRLTKIGSASEEK